MGHPSGSILIYLIGQNEALERNLAVLAASVQQKEGLFCRIARGGPSMGSNHEEPAIVLVDLDSMTDAALDQIPRYRQESRNGWIVVTYETPSSERLLKAVRAGANDYLPYSPTAAEFHALLARALEGQQGAAGSKLAGQLICVLSHKGGVGTTTLAVDVASSLAAQSSSAGSVVLVDLVLQHGDVCAFLDVPTAYTVSHLIAELDRADSSYLTSVLPKHPSGIYVLPAPHAPLEAEQVTSDQIGRLLQTLRRTFRVVVVDAGSGFTDLTLAVLDAADRILLVTTPSLPSVRNTRRCLELLENLRFETSKLILVANRYDAYGRLEKRVLEEALGRQIQWDIPNHYEAAVQATNQGKPIRVINPQGPFATQLDALVAKHLLGHSGNGQHPALKTTFGVAALRSWFGKHSNGTA